jgi:hypothetical protein
MEVTIDQGSELFFLPTARLTLTMAREGTPQNFSSRTGGAKQYVATKDVDPICKFLSYIN